MLFPPEDLPLLVLPRSDKSEPIKYINPLSPPTDPNDRCWGARCYFADIRAGNAQTLILSAGWLHFVLTIEDTAMVCLDTSNVSNLARSLKSVQRQRELVNMDTSALELCGRFEHRGFCLLSMLKRFV